MQCVCGQNWCEAWDTCSARPGRAGHRLPGSTPAQDEDVVWPTGVRGWPELAGRWRASWAEQWRRPVGARGADGGQRDEWRNADEAEIQRLRDENLHQDPLRPGWMAQSPITILHETVLDDRGIWPTSVSLGSDLDSIDNE